MARSVITQLTDDLDGSPATETVTFAYQGRSYEIDLSAEHARELEEHLGPYLEHGRRLRKPRGKATGGNGQRELDTKAVRQWAKDEGIEVPRRGRIPQDIVRRYVASVLTNAPRDVPA
jgi:hypothetical protein